MKPQLYNILTVSEDTQFTFQLRTRPTKHRLCEMPFIVDSIDSLRYTRGSAGNGRNRGVAHVPAGRPSYSEDFFRNFMIRVLLYDHTFAFRE